jgi:uncharacterized protein (TIGR02147 family)
MEIFDFTKYKEFIRNKVHTYPKKGHGIYRKLGLHIGLNSVEISQIFKGHRDLTLEQALAVSEFFNFNSLEQEYFLLMVQYERAGNFKLKKIFSDKMLDLQKKSKNIKDRLTQSQDISLEAKSIYYSNWIYSALRIASSINESQSLEALSKKLGLPANEIARYMEFLTVNGICKKEHDQFSTGIGITHLDASSPYAINHHRNWRIKSMEKMNCIDNENLFYTIPVSLSLEDVKVIRKKILSFIEELNQIVRPSPAQEVACLNLDWFKYGK